MPPNCPHCNSLRLHRSHRRGMMDQLFARFGAELKRCHDCRRRFARFKLVSLPLGVRDDRGGLASPLAVSTGFMLCLLLVLWIVRRLGMQG